MTCCPGNPNKEIGARFQVPAKAGVLIIPALFLFGLVSCNDEPNTERGANAEGITSASWVALNQEMIGIPVEGNPWITDLIILDLDKDGLKDVLLCEGRLGEVSWIRPV